MKFLAGVLVTLAAIAVAVIVVAYLGLYPIGADNAPSSVEQTIAMRAMDVYADKHKPSADNPIKLTAENLTDGAREYEEHCAFCHGGAKARVSPMEHQFNPPVPQLVNQVPDVDDAWLFWVTKHGVRMTGMPSWGGVMSDDDIWKVVAFLKQSDHLPPEAQAAWQQAAAEPGTIAEHVHGGTR